MSTSGVARLGLPLFTIALGALLLLRPAWLP